MEILGQPSGKQNSLFHSLNSFGEFSADKIQTNPLYSYPNPNNLMVDMQDYETQIKETLRAN